MNGHSASHIFQDLVEDMERDEPDLDVTAERAEELPVRYSDRTNYGTTEIYMFYDLQDGPDTDGSLLMDEWYKEWFTQHLSPLTMPDARPSENRPIPTTPDIYSPSPDPSNGF